MVGKLADMSIRSFKDALAKVDSKELQCGKIDNLMLKLLAYPTDLKRKAEIMLMLLEMAPEIEKLISKIEGWSQVYKQLQQEQMLKDTVAITLKLGMALNQQKNVRGFDLKALLRLFELKSTYDKDKTAYQIVMKQYLRMHSLQWL